MASWLAMACGPTAPAKGAGDRPAAPEARLLPQEKHLSALRQLTFGGENAEAYWSFSGHELVMQVTPPGAGCDQIFRLDLQQPHPQLVPVSNGQGVTTCSYFLPGDRQIIYASTHLAGAACPPKPDHSQGYVWPLYPSYDIFRVERDGTRPVRLTHTPGYDAEATVCPKDGSMVFTSVRDGDIELYRMAADGSHVERLTNAPGYDGGAFFNSDCSKIVWRASRPRGKALEDYRRLLAQGLVRPTKLELYVAKADGSDARQITYLDAASFAPFWHPNGKRILFSTNWGDPRGREFDIWAIDADGTRLERITFSPGFDGFPMFSPDGKWLAFSSNRATAPGEHDTNVFVARWTDEPTAPTVELGADRVRADIAWLADPARQGRGLRTAGLAAAGAYLEKRFGELGLGPVAGKSMRQTVSVPVGVTVAQGTALTLDGKAVAEDAYRPFGASKTGAAKGAVVFAGWGIVAPALGIDDYAGLDARGKVVLVRRFVPEEAITEPEAQRRYSDLSAKAFTARDHGAVALLVTDLPPAGHAAGAKAHGSKGGGQAHGSKGGGQAHGTAHGGHRGHGGGHGAAAGKPEAALPELRIDGYGDTGIPVMVVKRAVAAPLLRRLERHLPVRAALTVALDYQRVDAFNVVAKLAANAPAGEKLPGVVVLGAHYDHLGFGGPTSLAPDSHAPHLGADDNASGVAAMLEIARQLGRSKAQRRRDLWLVGFTAEEAGVMGSSHFARHIPGGLHAEDLVAMVNLDMVGTMRNDDLQVLGTASASEWDGLVDVACAGARVLCRHGGEGIGRSDHTPFYNAGVPVVHLLTGPHERYHKPSDSVEHINAAGVAQTAEAAASLLTELLSRPGKLSYRRVAQPLPVGDLRSHGASLGSVPDYGPAPKGQRGMLLSGVRPGGPAEKAGMRRGDVLVKLSRFDISGARDLMYALGALKPDQTVKAVIIRAGKRLELEVTLGKRARRRH